MCEKQFSTRPQQKLYRPYRSKSITGYTHCISCAIIEPLGNLQNFERRLFIDPWLYKKEPKPQDLIKRTLFTCSLDKIGSAFDATSLEGVFTFNLTLNLSQLTLLVIKSLLIALEFIISMKTS